MEATAVLVSAGVILGAFGALIAQLYLRTSRLEREIQKANSYNRRMWQWARRHLDLYYRHRIPGSPDPVPIPDEDDDEELKS